MAIAHAEPVAEAEADPIFGIYGIYGLYGNRPRNYGYSRYHGRRYLYKREADPEADPIIGLFGIYGIYGSRYGGRPYYGGYRRRYLYKREAEADSNSYRHHGYGYGGYGYHGGYGRTYTSYHVMPTTTAMLLTTEKKPLISTGSEDGIHQLT